VSSPLSAFHDDDGQWSMTRTVAWIFALTYCYVLVLNAANSHLMNWPFCVLGVVVLLAVPLQAFFRYLQLWFSSSPGQKLLGTLMEKAMTVATGSTSTTVHTEEKRG
jgi:hypothetical protein